MFEAKATYLASAALAGVLAVALQAPAQAQSSNEQYDAGHQRRVQSQATQQQGMTQQRMTQQQQRGTDRFAGRERLGNERRNASMTQQRGTERFAGRERLGEERHGMNTTRNGREMMARSDRGMRYTREGRDMRFAREGRITGHEGLRGYNGRERFAGRDVGIYGRDRVGVYGREGGTDIYARNRGTDVYARGGRADIYARGGRGTDVYARGGTDVYASTATAPGTIAPMRDRYRVVGYTYPAGTYGSGWNGGYYAPGGWNATYYGSGYGYPADYGYYNGPFNPVGAAVGGALDIANAATFGLFGPPYGY